METTDDSVVMFDAEYLIANPQERRKAKEWMSRAGIDPNSVVIDAEVEFHEDGGFSVQTRENGETKWRYSSSDEPASPKWFC